MNKGKPSKRKKVTEKKFTVEQMTKAIRDSLGSVAYAARSLKCKRPTIYNYLKEFPEIKAVLDKTRATYVETCQELARDNHLSDLLAGNSHATAYELAKLDPKPQGVAVDWNKLNVDEVAALRALMEKGKPDGVTQQDL